MFAKLKDFFDRAHSKRLEEILKKMKKSLCLI
jgi:hypothetical protein